MKNRLILNLLLATILIALGVITWLKPGQQNSPISPITALDINAIQHIKITRKKAQTIELQRVKNKWFIIKPVEALALAGKIERLLKISQIVPAVTYPLDNTSLDKFGLNTPVAQLSFNNETLNIGNTESVHSRRYVSHETQLFLLDDTFLHHLTAPVDAYIDTRLLPDSNQITGLQTPQITLQRQADNTWKNPQTPSVELSSDAVQMLLDEWRFARAINMNTIVNQTPGKPVMISFSEGPSLNFKLIEQQTNVILISTVNKLAYTFSQAKYKKMTTLPTLGDPDA
ncbi:MAG: DUF4340 domain-containing protein [Cycloclasticus sp.]|nr:DUF4340 domain-containing protein [Cycloclasticus sp.]